jgi:hypothetical protein
MASKSLTRLSVSRQELREFNLPRFPALDPGIVTGDPARRAMLVQKFNQETERWRNEIQSLLQQWLLALKLDPKPVKNWKFVLVRDQFGQIIDIIATPII